MTTTAHDEPPFDPHYQVDSSQSTASIGAERALLGAALLAERVLDDVAGLIGPDDFYRPIHGLIWRTLLDMRAGDIPIDPVTVFEQLRGDPTFLRGGGSGAVLLHNLTHEVPTTANATYYAVIVAEQAARRRLVEAGHRIWQMATDSDGADLDELNDLARGLVDAATVRRITDVPALGDILDDYVNNLVAPAPGVVQTPWPDLDEILNGGLHKGELVIVAARPSVGKSIIGLSCAKAAAQLDIPTLVFSLEMRREEIISRLIADVATVPLQNLIRHELTPDDQARALRCADRIRDWPLWIDDRSTISVAEIAALCRQHQRDGLGLVVIDYLGLIDTVESQNTNRQEQVARMSRELTKLAKELGLPIVLLHQLNRGPELRSKSRPVLADLRESGQIEADAHKVLLLWRPEDEPGRLVVIVAKNRNGPLANVPLAFSGRYARARSDDFTRTML